MALLSEDRVLKEQGRFFIKLQLVNHNLQGRSAQWTSRTVAVIKGVRQHGPEARQAGKEREEPKILSCQKTNLEEESQAGNGFLRKIKDWVVLRSKCF